MVDALKALRVYENLAKNVEESIIDAENEGRDTRAMKAVLEEMRSIAYCFKVDLISHGLDYAMDIYKLRSYALETRILFGCLKDKGKPEK